jgi:aspartate carbamoyltransferase catalytic subunit
MIMRSFAGRNIISLKDFERHEFERVFEVAEILAPIAWLTNQPCFGWVVK